MKNESHVYIITFIKAFFLTIATFLTPIKGLLIITGMAVLLDTIFAVYTTIRLNGWESYQSTKLFNIVVKSFFYLGSIVLAYFIDTHIIEKNTLFGINLLMSKAVTIFWLYIELKSIDETSQKLGNKPFLDIINGIVKWLKSFKKDINEIKE